jgi:putative peptidoglycan lipid II flippase
LSLTDTKASPHVPPEDGFAGLAADSRTVAIWTLLSRITGLGRVVAIAAVLGPTYFANLYQTLNTLPNIVHVMLVGQLISALLVPALVRHLDSGDHSGASRLANGFLGTIVLVASVVIGVCAVAAPLVLEVITAVVTDSATRQDQLHLGWPLLIMVLPQIILYGIIATAVAVQQAHRRFALPAAAPALENIGTIAVMVASAWLYGTGKDVHEISATQLVLIGVGSTIAVCGHALAQWWGAYRVGVVLIPGRGWRNSEVRQIIRLALPSSGYAALNSGTLFGLLVVAGAIPGGAVAFQMGLNFFSLPLALGALPAAAALLPRLSRGFDQASAGAMGSIYRDSLMLASFVALPASLTFLCLPTALAHIVSFGEMSSSAGMALVAAAVGSLGLGVIGEAVLIVATSAAYAYRDAVSPFRAMLCRTLLAFAGMVLAMVAFKGVAMIWALGLSFSAATLVSGAYLHLRQVRLRRFSRTGEPFRFVGELAASCLAIAPGWFVLHMLGSSALGPAENFLVGFAAVAVSGLTYLAAQWLRGSREFTALFTMDRSRSKSAAPQTSVEWSGK